MLERRGDFLEKKGYSVVQSPTCLTSHGYMLVADHVTSKKRSAIMAQVRTKNTGPELVARKMLHRLGYRYRLHRRDLPGSPDIVFPRPRLAIFVNGCFWHGHACRYGRLPKSKLRYWRPKIEANRTRDILKHRQLRKLGWDFVVVWQCELRNPDSALKKMVKFLRSRCL